MQDDPHYDDVVGEVHAFLARRAAPGPRRPGCGEVWVDPGIGFGKTADHNLVAPPPPRRAGRRGGRRGCAGVSSAPAASASSAAWPRPRGRRAGPRPSSDRLEGSVRHRHLGHGRRGAAMVRVHDVAGRRSQAGPAVWSCRMKGKWAAGIPPRNFTWVIQDHLAVSERPGGFAPTTAACAARRRSSGCASGLHPGRLAPPVAAQPGRLRRGGLAWSHFPLGAPATRERPGSTSTSDIDDSLAAGLRILVHQEELGDRIMGVIAGYLVWSGRITDGPQAIAVVEQIVGHAMGAPGRELLAELEGMPTRGTPT